MDVENFGVFLCDFLPPYVTDSEFNYLRQLFRFNGIPHYELVLKDGSISKEKLGTHRIRKYLEEHFPVSESAGQGENDQ